MPILYKTRIADGAAFMALMEHAVSEELVAKAKAYLETNIVEFGKLHDSSGTPDRLTHLVVYMVNGAEKIVGFRYFFFDPSRTLCNLFATFVDFRYRRIGIARRLIKKSFEVAAWHGCSEFKILLTQPSQEKDALFSWYCRYAEANEHQFKFNIVYWKKSKSYGYPGRLDFPAPSNCYSSATT